MKKRLLAWLLAGAMIGSVMPVHVSAAEGLEEPGGIQEQAVAGEQYVSEGWVSSANQMDGAVQRIGEVQDPAESQNSGRTQNSGGMQTPGESQNASGEQASGGSQNSGGTQNSGGMQTPGENQNANGDQTSGGNQNASGNQNANGDQISGGNQNANGDRAPGGNQNANGDQAPGGNQNANGDQAPGGNQNSGEATDSGNHSNPGDSQDDGNDTEGNDPAENLQPVNLPDSEASDKNKPNTPGSNKEPPAGEEASHPSVMPADVTPAENPSGEGDSTAEDTALSQADAQARQLGGNWEVPLDGMQFTYLEVPGDILARAEEIDADSQEWKNSGDGLERDIKGSQKYRTVWDTYSSNYIYNHLSAAQKKFWDALDYICYQYLTKNLDAIRYPYDWNHYYGCSKWKVMYGKMGLTYEQARNIYIMFAYSNPQYYFLDSSVMVKQPDAWSPKEWIVLFYGKFSDGQDRKAETAAVSARIQEMKKIISQGKNDVEKARIAHDLIIRTVDYDHGYLVSPKNIFHQSAYSVLCEGYTVCAGYAKAYELLMNAVGIDTMAVTSATHAWNLIRLNDSWYHVDCTWDDKDGSGGYEGVYTYFGRKTSRITGDLDKNSFHQMEYFYNKKVPKCTQDSGAALTSIGTFKTPASQAKRPVLKAKKVSGGMQVTLTTATSGARIYYTLDGKAPSPSFGRCYRYTKPFKVSSNVTVKAIAIKDQSWDSVIRSAKVKGKVCTVKFNAMGGKKVSSKKVHYDTVMKKPSAKRSGYRFVGWYQDKKCKKVWNFRSRVKKNMTLYAKWKKK